MAFITKTGASNILGGTLSGPQFCTKEQIVGTGLADDAPLSGYSTKDFVESDDVVAKPSNGLILDCPFTSSAIDLVTGVPLTLVDNNTTYDISYSQSNGAYFRSKMGLRAIRDEFIFPDHEFTIAFKFCTISKGSGHTIGLFFGERSGSRQISVNIPESGGWRLIWKTYSTPNSWYQGGDISQNTWFQFVCCIKNLGTTLRARSWLNGTKIGDSQGPGFPTLNGTMIVGNDTAMSTEGVTGYIKDLKIWNICLSDEELNNII